MIAQKFFAEGRTVLGGPQKKTGPNGAVTAITLGFPVCTVDEMVCDPEDFARWLARVIEAAMAAEADAELSETPAAP